MNLKRSQDPARLLMWNGKSIATCSRKELIECVLYMGQQLAMAGRRIQEYQTLEQAARNLVASVPPAPVKSYNEKQPKPWTKNAKPILQKIRSAGRD